LRSAFYSMLLIILLLTGCGNDTQKDLTLTGSDIEMTEMSGETKTTETTDATEIYVDETTSIDEIEVDVSLKPNEAGKIMILMYHSIGQENSAWEITPQAFREDLEYLYQNNYRPIALKDYVRGEINVPAGYTPVVLTFDDGNRNNFNIFDDKENLEIDPDCAVGIMQAYNQKYIDFNITATFFVFGTNPFRQQKLIDYKLRYLIDNGYDIGNHTYHHVYMNQLQSSEEIQEELGKMNNFLRETLSDYTIESFSIPYGIHPVEDLKPYMLQGEFEGISYNHIAAVEVGWNPSYSCFDSRFSAHSLPRIRASQTEDHSESEEWFKYFEEKPELKFVSDGYRDIVTAPISMADLIDEELLGEKRLYIYEE